MRYLAIDHGTKYTGLAVCDRNETISSPLAVVKGPVGLLDKIIDIIKAENIEAIVLGMPLNMDDSQGPQAKLVLKFAEQLKKLIQIPIHFQDERLSTFAAEQKMAVIEVTKKSRKRLDAIAAADILETFLEQKK